MESFLIWNFPSKQKSEHEKSFWIHKWMAYGGTTTTTFAPQSEYEQCCCRALNNNNKKKNDRKRDQERERETRNSERRSIHIESTQHSTTTNETARAQPDQTKRIRRNENTLIF